jgi:NIPSNAP
MLGAVVTLFSTAAFANLYELRIYEATPGRMADLNKRFDTVTLKIWEKHGIRQVGFWTALIGTNNQLIYMLEWKDLAEREKLWTAFQQDPEWIKARDESEKNGPLTVHITNSILTPTSYSKLK